MRLKRLFQLTLTCALGAACLTADPAAYVVSSTGQFGLVDLATGQETLIANEAQPLISLAPGSGQFYATDMSGNLLSLNMQTGGQTLVGNTGLQDPLVAGFSNGALFALDANENLYSLQSNGSATLIGATGLPTIPLTSGHFANSFTAGNGVLYYTLELSGTSNDLASTLYSINPLTGQSTVVGPTNAAGIESSGLVNGSLYAFSYGPADIVTLSTNDGAATAGAPLSGDFAMIFGAAPVPEPSAVLLTGSGLLGAGIAFLRRKRAA